MPILFFFLLAIIFTGVQVLIKKDSSGPYIAETLLSYLLLFCLGFMGLLAAYAHIFMGPETARSIGWLPYSPFQFEMGMANFAFGVLGIMSFWIRDRFWDAVVIGWSILFLGCFIGHLREYYDNNNAALYNIGYPIWLGDLFIPLLALCLLFYLRPTTKV